MKTLLYLRAVTLIFLIGVLTPCICSGGMVTLTGGGVAQLSYSFGSGQDPVWAQAGTFPALTDIEIMELAGVPTALLQHWVPFADSVKVSCGDLCPALFPPPQSARFDMTATVALDPSSPLSGRPVYVIVSYEIWDYRALVVHKSPQSFPSGDSSAEIHVAVDPASPRLLAGGLVNQPGYPAQTVTPFGGSFYQNWSFAWFGDNPQAGPDDDPDGDGQTNADELTAGTNPLDAASRLELQWVSLNEDSVTFTWQAVPGKQYAIIQADTPQIIRPASIPANTIWFSTTLGTATVPIPPGANRRFFAIFAW